MFRLPNDLYQTTKVAKILQLMENRQMADFRNKNLDEINIDLQNEFVKYETNEDPGIYSYVCFY